MTLIGWNFWVIGISRFVVGMAHHTISHLVFMKVLSLRAQASLREMIYKKITGQRERLKIESLLLTASSQKRICIDKKSWGDQVWSLTLLVVFSCPLHCEKYNRKLGKFSGGGCFDVPPHTPISHFCIHEVKNFWKSHIFPVSKYIFLGK